MSESKRSGHAVVLGGGIGGLLCASVLARTFDRVTVVDRDDVPAVPSPRGGVPQGRHVHAFLARGVLALEQLLPGAVDELVARGAVRGDALAEATWLPNGRRLRSAASDLEVISASRPLIEDVVRRRVLRLENVRLLTRTAALDLLLTSDGARVRGVSLRRTGEAPRVCEAELVVDATGRSSRTPVWLGAHGYDAPSEERIDVGIGYVTRLFRVPPEALGGRVAVIHARTKAHPRGAVAQRIEGGCVLVSLTGYREHAPDGSEEGFAAHAKSLPHRDLEAILSAAEPVSPCARYRVQENLRRRYDLLERFPHGLVVMGDALCAFNPIYAQGMTVAALECLSLQACLETGRDDVGSRFFKSTARLVTDVWRVTASNDMEMPGVIDRRPRAARAVGAWMRQVVAAAEQDEALSLAFVRVANLVAPPASLLSPRVVARVALVRLWAAVRRVRLRLRLRLRRGASSASGSGSRSGSRRRFRRRGSSTAFSSASAPPSSASTLG